MREKHTFRWYSTWCKYKVWIWCLLEPIPTVQVQRRCIPIVIVRRWISLSIRTMAILRSSIVQIVFQIEDKINFVLDFCSVQFLLAEKFIVKVEQLRYESSTLILYRELSSSIFQSLSVSEWVSESGIGNTSPHLHIVQYIKACMPSTDPVSSITNCYRLIVSYTDPVHSFIIS